MPQTSITLPFADGEYTFRLPLKRIQEIQDACGAGIGEIAARVLSGLYLTSGGLGFGNPMEAKYRIEDLVGIIHQGLIGGGEGTVHGEPVKVDAARAKQLIDRYLADDVPLQKVWEMAAKVISAATLGYDPPGEAAPPEEAAAGEAKKTARSTTRKRSQTAP